MVRPRQRDVLVALLRVGDHSPSGISDATKEYGDLRRRSPESVGQSLSQMADKDPPLVESKGYGVWRLTSTGATLAWAYATE